MFNYSKNLDFWQDEKGEKEVHEAEWNDYASFGEKFGKISVGIGGFMEFGVVYIWSQVLTIIEYSLLGATYLMKNRKVIVILDIVSMVAGIIAFLLLGADLGMLMSIIILLANFYYLWEESLTEKMQEAKLKRWLKANQGWKNLVLVLTLGGIFAVTLLTYDGPLSLLSVLATVLYEVSIWQRSTKVYKALGIPVAFCWMTYNGFVRSIAGVVFEGFMLIASIVGYVRELRKTKRLQ